MGIRIGQFDIGSLIFGILDMLLRKNYFTADEARTILRDALPPDNEMPAADKDKLVNSMITDQSNPV